MVARALCAAAMQSPSLKRLEELFTAEPDRLSRLSFEIAGLYFDWSKTHLDKSVIAQSLARADWAPAYGMLTDRFGVTWILGVTPA